MARDKRKDKKSMAGQSNDSASSGSGGQDYRSTPANADGKLDFSNVVYAIVRFSRSQMFSSPVSLTDMAEFAGNITNLSDSLAMGFVISNTEESVILAQMMDYEEVEGILVIPRGSIVSISLVDVDGTR